VRGSKRSRCTKAKFLLKRPGVPKEKTRKRTGRKSACPQNLPKKTGPGGVGGGGGGGGGGEKTQPFPRRKERERLARKKKGEGDNPH